jgi:DNA primase
MSDTQTIKDNLDIVDFINEYVQLKPAGSNHKGLCPFHNEKSPSFMVSRERQSWRCFGCNKGGDIFSFVQEIEGMEFVEALKLLADKAGITLTHNFSGNKQAGEKKVRLKQIMEAAVHFYHQFLLKMDSAADARKYLQERGLQQHTIDVWKIGFVPDQWDLLTQYLLKKGYAIDDLVDAGLTMKRDAANNRGTGKGYYDRFRGRIMFPIHDAHGNAVGLTGRVLVETETSGGKYVNTPQTDIYDKSSILFGLDKAKTAMRQKDQVIVVEGQMDVIAVWQSGMEQVVASSGTALTEQQVKHMSRYTKHMLMAFDTDTAGLAAAKRGIGIALEAGMHVRVIQIPQEIAKDPDECIKKSPTVWEASVQNATSVLAWYISLAVSEHDLTTPLGKQAAADDVLPEIIKIPYAVEQDHWMRELASAIGVDVAVLKTDAERHTIKKRKGTHTSTKAPLADTAVIEKSPFDLMVEELVSLLLTYPFIATKVVLPAISEHISHVPLRTLYKQIETLYTAHQSITLEHLETSETRPYIDSLLLSGAHRYETHSDIERNDIATTLVSRIIDSAAHTSKTQLIAELAKAEAAGDTVRVQEILSQLQ